jgi:hypothetical protein
MDGVGAWSECAEGERMIHNKMSKSLNSCADPNGVKIRAVWDPAFLCNMPVKAHPPGLPQSPEGIILSWIHKDLRHRASPTESASGNLPNRVNSS